MIYLFRLCISLQCTFSCIYVFCLQILPFLFWSWFSAVEEYRLPRYRGQWQNCFF